MRIACVHVPQFALQAATRRDPSLRGAAVAVVGAATRGAWVAGAASGFAPTAAPPAAGGGRYGVAPAGGAPAPVPVVVACSRAAWALGVRPGMTAAAVRAVAAGEVRIEVADPSVERETARAISDALRAVTPACAVGVAGGVADGADRAHLAVYAEVPARTRGATFGERALEVLAALGLAGRVGIADDRFTAWVAAAAPASGGGARTEGGRGVGWSPVAPAPTGGLGAAVVGAAGEGAGLPSPVVSVPRGGSAAFLAPRPLSLLAISPEVLHVLEALGVRTLGEFAALPAPSVVRPWEVDYQALARGEGDGRVHPRPARPEAWGPACEEIVVGADDADAAGALSAVALVAGRLALRLTGLGRSARRLAVTTWRPAAGAPHAGVAPARVEVELAPHAARDAEALAIAIVGAAELTASVRLRVEVLDLSAEPREEAATAGAEAHGLAAGPGAPDAPGALGVPGVAARWSAGSVGAAAGAPPRSGTAALPGLDAVSVALSSPGTLFELAASRGLSLVDDLGEDEGPYAAALRARRAAPRRTRRGKQRARVAPAVQARLFAGMD